MSVIHIRDRQDMLEISFEDICKYHGGVALMAVAVGFRSLQVAFEELFGNEIPERKSISIFSGHGGPGFRDAFEYVTRAVTRGAYHVDTAYPVGQYDPFRPQSYAFVISSEAGASVEITLNDHFLPMAFYEYLKKGREETMTEADINIFKVLKQSLAEEALATPLEELFTIRRIQ
ncbi:hypothetical protein [Paenibacillus glacialis]|uniref:Formylmethanofuran dehydrogenase subunit E domain-containing protein n=1 Tax=Paenibacillus glacialis TaxID=494026 RepID=A0A168FA87_9BACL|nr:hypothetical protein [Paenibacillus glacialis]OAB36006.1 hypothetical protein PGLA_21525 [Paenibacillus glacialis]